jgi:Spy/CpxP family protein refolding chaperone
LIPAFAKLLAAMGCECWNQTTGPVVGQARRVLAQRDRAALQSEVWMRVALVALLLLSSAAAIAQGPYAGMQSRTIKALSPEQVSDLNAGRGMGLALAAELNGYPGPVHVLELADKLELSPDQRSRIETLFNSMKAEAQPLGAKLIQEESDLDRLFESRSITPASLKASMAAIGVTQGALRETHLKYHLSTAAILTPAQMRRYAELRGYGDQPAVHPHHH